MSSGGYEKIEKAKEKFREKVKQRKRILWLKLVFKRRKPEFLRHLWWKFPKFQNNLKWKRPRGKDNKMRLKLKGYPPVVSVGYRSPSAIRGLHPSGLEPVVVANARDLEKLDPSKHIVYIARGVSLRKHAELVKLAVQKGFRVANP